MTLQGYKSIACPVCGVPAGANCFRSGVSANKVCCPERANATMQAPRHLMSRPVFTLGPEPGGNCKAHEHAKCSGRCRARYGMPGPRCTCSCHRRKAE